MATAEQLAQQLNALQQKFQTQQQRMQQVEADNARLRTQNIQLAGADSHPSAQRQCSSELLQLCVALAEPGSSVEPPCKPCAPSCPRSSPLETGVSGPPIELNWILPELDSAMESLFPPL
eukprot:4352100-Amphidinium_carterae.1